MDRIRNILISTVLALGAAAGCAPNDSKTVADQSDHQKKQSADSRGRDRATTETADSPEPRSDARAPETSGESDSPSVTHESPNTSDATPPPRRPTDGWVIFRAAFDPKRDADCNTAWLGRNQFEIKTNNVQRITVDMTRVPEGAPRKGPWIFQIDSQAVELTGFAPQPGYTGLKRDLVRSVNGKWSIDRETLYRVGP